MPLTDPDATLDADQDPAADTQADDNEDTAEDTPQDAVDWEARYRELQSFHTRKVRELESQVQAPDEEAEDEDEEEYEDEEPDTDAGAERLEMDSWRLAEREYGKDAVTAYGKAARLLDRASTPSDFVAAFEAYYASRLEAETKRFAKEQSKGQAPETAQPPVDTNRPDVGPRSDYDRQAEAAFAKGDSKGFLLAQIQRIRGS